MGLGKAGDKQSSTMAVSLKTSAASRYILHSGSRAVPRRCAKRIVAMRPVDSWSTERRSAEVGEAVESPTPTPGWVVRWVVVIFAVGCHRDGVSPRLVLVMYSPFS